jgi:histidine phosphotransferase ChpT
MLCSHQPAAKRAFMSLRTHPSDLEFAALLSSKICHDALNPVGSIQNGLELLGGTNQADQHRYALDMIRNVTQQASARLQFARFAFGASAAAGSTIDLKTSETLAFDYVGLGKHKLTWSSPSGFMAKDKVKLLLNLIPPALTALPRGGEIAVTVTGTLEHPSFELRCQGQNPRMPQYLSDLVAGNDLPIDAFSIQSYYCCRLASAAELHLSIEKDGNDVVIRARPLNG